MRVYEFPPTSVYAQVWATIACPAMYVHPCIRACMVRNTLGGEEWTEGLGGPIVCVNVGNHASACYGTSSMLIDYSEHPLTDTQPASVDMLIGCCNRHMYAQTRLGNLAYFVFELITVRRKGR